MGYGRGYTGTYSGNAETDKPLPKVARVAFLSRPIRSPGDLILDPSLGDGHFLVEAARRLRELGSRVPTKQLSGVDLNPNAVEETRRTLARAEPTASASKINLRVEDFFAVDPPGDLFQGLPDVDAVVGNPPYIRYQSFTGASRARALHRAHWAGVQLTSLWATAYFQIGKVR
ncbi:MAG: N-6 DNA methylase [Gammaproteobacteria bacterium]